MISVMRYNTYALAWGAGEIILSTGVTSPVDLMQSGIPLPFLE
jgi:hypothetical protein